MTAPVNGHIQPECSSTSKCVAYKIQPGECSAQCNGNEPVVFQAQERDYIEVLSNLHAGSKQKNIQRQQAHLVRNDHPGHAAQQQGDQHITDIGPDKGIMNKSGDANLYCHQAAEDQKVGKSFLIQRYYTSVEAKCVI